MTGWFSECELIREEENYKKLKNLHKITRVDLLVIPMSSLMFLADIASDLYLTATYYNTGQVMYGSLTGLFIVLPVICTYIEENIFGIFTAR